MKRAALFFSLLLALLLCACQAAPQEPELPPDALVDYLALSELSPQPVPCTESALADLLPLTVLGNTHETVFTYFQDGQMTISHQLEMQHCVSDENGASLFTPDRAVVMRDAALLFLCFDDLDRVCIRFDWSGLNHWIGDSLIRLDNLYGRIWETTISRPEAEAALGFTVDDLRRLLDEGRFAEADSVLKANPATKIVAMGDFNDDPTDESVEVYLGAKTSLKDLQPGDFYTPFADMLKAGLGSLAYRDTWNLFDNIVLTENLACGTTGKLRIIKDPNKKTKYYGNIFKPSYLIQKEGQFKGYPLRTFVGNNFQGGYSDHLPVFIYIDK